MKRSMHSNFIIVRGRGLSRHVGEGYALVSEAPISFFGGVDPRTGRIVEPGHPLEGVCVSGRVLVYPYGKGSTVGAYVLYQMSKLGTAPRAIVNVESDHVTIVGCIISELPLVDRLELNPMDLIRSGDYVLVDGVRGVVKIFREHG